tara:strand:+ start:1067 stop:1213 length:147 start_codon:yes stop_codon:yes gene_type:complete
MQMNMVDDACASSPAHVNPNIHTMGLVRLSEYQLGKTSKFHEFGALLT